MGQDSTYLTGVLGVPGAQERAQLALHVLHTPQQALRPTLLREHFVHLRVARHVSNNHSQPAQATRQPWCKVPVKMPLPVCILF